MNINMKKTLTIGKIQVEITFKDIKNIHLSVMPPAGEVVVSAPIRMETETVRIYLISRLQWIRSQQKLYFAQERETPREYLYLEKHYLLGKKLKLNIIEGYSDEAYNVKSDQNLQ